ncbi:T9SS C-terminal target domain-containing protein [candidate division KSB1 bacterium]|nr:MAG: T9SS C-terminal target domain-containing protein [candidate division KSB1 bacterium]
MKRVLFTLAAILALTSALMAQPVQFGAVQGLVNLADGTPVPAAQIHMVRIHDGGMHGPRPPFMMLTGPDGTFGFPSVPVGRYEINAMAPRLGFARGMILVEQGLTTNVTLTIQHRDTTPRPPRDSLTIVELTGTAIVVHPDSLHPRRTLYALDVNADGAPDFRLSFGPPWYNPPSGAVRPENGDQITIQGGLLTFAEPPVIVVFEINGLVWRIPGQGHGGHGGGDHGNNGCNPDSVTLVELEGTAEWLRCIGFHGETPCIALNTDDDPEPEYRLDFGGPNYDPGNGATRPLNGEEVTIVGGQIYCPNAEVPIVIVYEINGVFWREPGDTVGLGAAMVSAVEEPVYIGAPTSYVTVNNYPNPFNPVTTISYSIPVAGDVTLKVFDLTGREVAELVNTHQTAGAYAVPWNGSTHSSGIYFYRLSAGNTTHTGRMVLMK